jgi:hypothetical protein
MLEDYTLSAVRGCLFNLFAATLHMGGRSTIRNLRTRHAVVTGTHIHGVYTTYAVRNYKSSLFRDVTQHRLVVSYRQVVPKHW